MLTVLALTVALQTPAIPTCGALRLEAGACAQAPYGVVIGDDQGVADHFAEVMRQGEVRFRAHFGREPTTYAVMVGDTVNPVSTGGVSGAGSFDLQAALSEAGAQHVLPWFTAEQRARLIAEASRPEIEAAARKEGFQGDALSTAVEQRVAAAAAAAPIRSDQDSAAAHELGHMWTVAAFWPDRDNGAAIGHYGGPAADWFDESSAVLMEDDAMAAGRRDGFRKNWTTANGVRPKPLASYFVDAHPLAGGVRTRIAASQLAGARPVSELPGGELRTPDGRVIRLEDLPPGAVFIPADRTGTTMPGSSATDPAQPRSLSVASSAAFGSDAERDVAVMFYAQARVFADFLIERTGDPKVYSRIAAALARGDTMEHWIAAEGPALNLAATVDELETQWREWLTRTYGAPA